VALVFTKGRVEHVTFGPASWCIVNIRIEKPTGINVPPSPPGPNNELLVVTLGGQLGVLFVTELSRALASGLRVTVTHEDDSAHITSVTLIASTEGSLI